MTKTKAETTHEAKAEEKVLFDPSSVSIVKKITFPLWKWEIGVTKYFRIEGPIYRGKDIKEGATKENEKPADLMVVTNLETGEEMQVIVGAVLKGNMEDHYKPQKNGKDAVANEAGLYLDADEYPYVGKCFMSEQSKIEKRRYKGYSLTEIECPEIG